MGETLGETYLIDAPAEAEVHRSVQDLWRAQNAAWRTRVLGQLRQAGPVEDLRAASA